SMPVAPLCNPQDLFRGSRDESRPRELSHTTCHQCTHDVALFAKLQRIESERIASSIRQWRQMWESLRIIQHADHPDMIESALRTGCINHMELERNRVAYTVEGCDFGSPKIIGFHRPAKLYRFHNQCRKLRHSGTDIETAAAPGQFPPQHRSDSTPETATRPSFRSPKLIAAFITIDWSQGLIVEATIHVCHETSSCRGQPCTTRLHGGTPAMRIAVAVTVATTLERNSRFNVSTASVARW